MMGTQQVAIEGVRLAVRRGAPASATVSPGARRVLFVHGAGRTSAIWAPLVEELSTDRQVLSVDRRGYGESEAVPAVPAQEARNYAALLVREGDATAEHPLGQGADRPVDQDDNDGNAAAADDRPDLTDVVAEGDGIDVALALSALRPDLVGRLVLIEGPRRTGTLARWKLRTGRRSSPAVDAAAPDRALLIADAPKGAVAAQRLMKALERRAADPSTIRMVTLPETIGAPLDAAPAAVTTIVAAFLRES